MEVRGVGGCVYMYVGGLSGTRRKPFKVQSHDTKIWCLFASSTLLSFLASISWPCFVCCNLLLHVGLLPCLHMKEWTMYMSLLQGHSSCGVIECH